ncbi:hypothetical protein Tco_0345641 [Tanacetum coccineum]
MNFMVIRSPSQHNAIIGRPGIRKIRAVPSTAHGMLKFPVEGGTVTLKSSRVIPLECAMISGPSIQPPTAKQVLEEKIKIAIHPEYPEQTVAIGSTLTEKGRKELCALLKQNLDIFAWKPADIQQKKRDRHRKEIEAIQEDVEKFGGCLIMKEVEIPLWVFPFKCFWIATKDITRSRKEKEDEEKNAFINEPRNILPMSKMPFVVYLKMPDPHINDGDKAIAKGKWTQPGRYMVVTRYKNRTEEENHPRHNGNIQKHSVSKTLSTISDLGPNDNLLRCFQFIPSFANV